MKRSLFLNALAAGGFAGALGAARLVPMGTIVQSRWRDRDERGLIGIPGRCQGSRSANPLGGYHLEDVLA